MCCAVLFAVKVDCATGTRHHWPSSSKQGQASPRGTQVATRRQRSGQLALGSQGLATTKQGQPDISLGPYFASSCSLLRSSVVLSKFRVHGSKTSITFGAPCIKDVTPLDTAQVVNMCGMSRFPQHYLNQAAVAPHQQALSSKPKGYPGGHQAARVWKQGHRMLLLSARVACFGFVRRTDTMRHKQGTEGPTTKQG